MRKLQLVLAMVLTAAVVLSLPLLAEEAKPSETKAEAKAEAKATTTTTTASTAAAITPAPAAPAAGPLQIKVGDATLKFGVLVQPQADFTENTAGAFTQNMMLRRTRFLVGGNMTKTIFFFFETENSRLGAATATAGSKTMSTGFQTLDAAVEWRPRKAFNLSGGLIRVPTSRDALESAATEYTIDFNTYAFTATTTLGGTAGRDTGLMARGYFFDDRLEYRAAIIAGMRETGNTNEFRTIGRLQYNFFDKEVYNFPSYAGNNFGTKKILAVGAAYDRQMYYEGITADVFGDFPTKFGSVLGTATFHTLDGGVTAPNSLAKSNIVTVDGGFYFKKLKAGTWARYEQRDFTTVNNRDEKKYMVGINFYPMGNNFNIKTGVGRIKPATGRDMTQFTVQLQAYYF